MDPHWFNYLLSKWRPSQQKESIACDPNYLHEPKQTSIVPQYVLDNMRYELDVFVMGANMAAREQRDWQAASNKDCAASWNAAFGIVGTNQIAAPPIECPHCKSKNIEKIADGWKSFLPHQSSV